MPKMVFVNLPVRDLAAATRFYEAIGCARNEQFSDHQASSMVWSDTITFQLLAHNYFQTFTPKKIADAKTISEVLIALSRDTREDVDATVDAGAGAGGEADIRERQDMGFMYNRCLADPDGHIFEFIWMDMSGASDASGQQPTSA